MHRLPLTRRELFGVAGLLMGGAVGRAVPAAQGKAKSVIQIWMWGGPPHLDTFDPKPDAGNDYTGPLTSPIETNVSGIRIGELLPQLAKQADKYSLIRSMTHGVNAHETASYTVQTGRASGGRDVFPSAGAVVSLLQGVQRRVQGPHPALHRPHRAPGPLLRSRLPRQPLQALRHRRRPRPAPFRRRRASSPPDSPSSASVTAATTSTSSTPSPPPSRKTRRSPPPVTPKNRPTS